MDTPNMSREEMLKEFKKIILPYTPDKSKLELLNEDTNLLRDLQINSANLIDIIIDAENAYNIAIDNDSVEKMTNVGTSLDVIAEKLKNIK